MNDLASVWHFTRVRLDSVLGDLSDEEMGARPIPGCHSIFDIVYHVCGAEHYWASRMGGSPLEDRRLAALLERAIFDDFLRDGTPPFDGEWLTRSRLESVMAQTFAMIRPIFEAPTPGQLEMRLTSPIGDPVTGREGLTRLAQHAGYHAGQIQLFRVQLGLG